MNELAAMYAEWAKANRPWFRHPDSAFDGITEAEARLVDDLLFGYRVRVQGHRKDDEPEEYIFDRILFPDSHSFGTCLLDSVGTMILHHPEYGMSHTRHLGIASCRMFEVVGPRLRKCQHCFNFRTDLRLVVQWEWTEEDSEAETNEWWCGSCRSDHDYFPPVRYGGFAGKLMEPAPPAPKLFCRDCDQVVHSGA